MSSQGRPSFAKRQKEQARQQKQQEKAVERTRRNEERKNQPPGGATEGGDVGEVAAEGAVLTSPESLTQVVVGAVAPTTVVAAK
jgi:hypothetical protein